MNAKDRLPFLDTNILIYAVSDDPRANVARAIIEARFVTSVQALNEFTNVARRKMKMPWSRIEEITDLFGFLAETLVAVDVSVHRTALSLAAQHQYSFYDALMLAAAEKAECSVFFSEDMHAGHVLNSGLEIRNPFKP